MRKIIKEIELFCFKELPKNIQEKIVEEWRRDLEFWPHKEFMQSCEAIANFLGIKLTDWSYDQYRYDYKLAISEDMENRRAYRMVDNLLTHAYKYNTKFKKAYYKHYSKIRKSRITVELDNCPFTGVCYDYSFYTAIQELRKADHFYEWDYSTFCHIIFDKLFAEIVAEYKYQTSFEGITEDIKNQDMEFTAAGEAYYE